MSSPIGHSLAGYTVYEIEGGNRNKFWQIILYAFIANAPDLDVLPGLLIGKPNIYHHGISHSIGVGIIFSLLLASALSFGKPHLLPKLFILYFILYGSHLLLDFFSYDGRPPIGIPVFWPVTSKYYISPVPFLPSVSHSNLDHASINQFLIGIFSLHNLKVITIEILVISPILIVKRISSFFRN